MNEKTTSIYDLLPAIKVQFPLLNIRRRLLERHAKRQRPATAATLLLAEKFAPSCEFRIPKQTNQTEKNNKHMSMLIVVSYDDPYKAEEVRLNLRKLQRENLLDLEDAVVAIKDQKGKVKLHQAINLTELNAFSGGFWGALIGLIFLSPVLGFVIGVSAGAASDALTEVGIDDHFMKELAATMTPGSSTLFVLVKKVTPDELLEELKGTGGRVLKTSLSHEDEAKLQAALGASKAGSPSRVGAKS